MAFAWIPMILDDPAIHETFNTTTLPLLQAKYDIANDIEGGKAPGGALMFSPRVGFNYDLSETAAPCFAAEWGCSPADLPYGPAPCSTTTV